MKIDVFRIEMSSPDDMRELKKLIDSGKIVPQEIIAVLGKTEGNGCVNDFTRALATFAFRKLIAQETGWTEEETEKRVAFIMSGGTEGVMSPHATIFCKNDAPTPDTGEKTLAVSSGYTRNFLPEEQGTVAMVDEVKRVTLELMREAGIDSPEDVHFVQIKCPLLTSERIWEARSRGKDVVTHDTYESMGYNRGASALGVAVALGEIPEGVVTNEDICKNWSIYSKVASTSAGIELLNCEIILMGNSTKAASDFKIGHSVMQDSIDFRAVIAAIENAGMKVDKFPTEEQTRKIVNVFAKAEADSTGYVRGRRNTLHTDSDINHTRHARAVVNAVIASIVNDPMVYVSGGAEHQGPDGGGPVAVIIEK
ncbi:ring-opening amidohydrolase [Flavonifractor porci]|uniref:cyanuric acid amidohydrolase n=1 Tax=Flavonifractor porci TaxID=3133422 RepID=UPI00309C3FB0